MSVSAVFNFTDFHCMGKKHQTLFQKNLLSCPTEQSQTDLQQHEVDCTIKQMCLTHQEDDHSKLRRQYQVVEGEETSVLSEHV